MKVGTGFSPNIKIAGFIEEQVSGPACAVGGGAPGINSDLKISGTVPHGGGDNYDPPQDLARRSWLLDAKRWTGSTVTRRPGNREFRVSAFRVLRWPGDRQA
jgi:hypothetical protein